MGLFTDRAAKPSAKALAGWMGCGVWPPPDEAAGGSLAPPPAGTNPHWLPLESNPDVLNRFSHQGGLSPDWQWCGDGTLRGGEVKVAVNKGNGPTTRTRREGGGGGQSE